MKTEYGLYTPTDWNRECELALNRVINNAGIKIIRYNYEQTGVLFIDGIKSFDQKSKEHLHRILMFWK